MDPSEIHDFAERMKNAGESAFTHIALGIAILATLLTLVSVLSERDATDAVSLEATASDIWNQYQAKKIRGDSAANSIALLQLQPTGNPAATSANIQDLQAKIAHWNADLVEAQRQAREVESKVAIAERKSARYDLSETLLQVAIVLASITLFTRKQAFWIVALALAAAGLVVSALALTIH